ncbi:MAG: 16S rRNA (guanine(527)-N(7))-methyltransferase RsmG [Firmicutes bacterium]|nr:16S rRNA (guanine(527)-N(7))-methyltransferase RsmG [Bacillota bacterium]
MINLKDAILETGLACSDDQVNKFETYMQGILAWNEKVNLTRITQPDEFIVKHFLDSLVCCTHKEYQNARKIIDVGTGAGFPGIPLAIMSADKNFVLMDSLGKRLKIIDELCAEAGISNVETIHARAEELARNKQHREKYDLCVSRAVANMAVLAEYCLPFIKVGGCLMAYKGPEAAEEAEAAKNAIKLLGGNLAEIYDASLEKYDISHKIVVIKKVKNTVSKYPRKAGTPTKEPLL